MATEIDNIQVSARSNAPQRIIAIGIVAVFLFWASSVVIAVLLAALMAYFLDPIVKTLERVRVPRSLGALLVLLLTTAIMAGGVYIVAGAAENFAGDWPRYSLVLRHVVADIDAKVGSIERQVSQIAPDQARGGSLPVTVQDSGSVRSVLVRAFQSLGSLYSVLLVVTFLPFLVFFMLAAKDKLWAATLELFPPSQRDEARDTLDEVSLMLRSYVAGTALVALILIGANWILFAFMGLDFAFLSAVVTGVFNMVPYIGAVLAWIPPVLIGMGQWRTVEPFVAVLGGLTVFHVVAANLLMPAIVGRRVHLNALAVTVALLFWGWLWGGFGLILAVPITGTLKVICDHVPSWRPVGRWLGA